MSSTSPESHVGWARLSLCLSAPKPGRRYLVAAPEAIHSPSIIHVGPGKLKTRRHHAEFLVIGPESFLGTARPLLRHRRRQGLRVSAVSLADVYSEFGFGEPRPEAIRDFVAYAYHQWRGELRYVLLLGDGSFDFKNYLGTDAANHVPPYIVKTSYLWTASDPAYAAVVGMTFFRTLLSGDSQRQPRVSSVR